ncbi:MFS transporter [Demequina sp. NBRC 110056]|uniref:MFS transporter n=1 Tax=Demequina sp. NBRC 110056 TaxID=1570345 RepID=UPI0009FD7A3A|nr:MFS transporter [Demequina sp. NBRC 110056]
MVAEQLPLTRVRSARLAVLGIFLAVGSLAGGVISRVPSVRDDLAVSPGQLGAILLVGSVGGLVGFSVLGGLVGRWGSRAVLGTTAVCAAGALLLMAAATALGFAPLYAFGLFVGLASLEMTMAIANTQAAAVERHVGSAIMSQFHAGFSLAMLAGLGLGAVLSGAGVSAAAHFVGIGVIVGGVVSVVARIAIIDDSEGSPESAAERPGLFVTVRLATRERRTILLGLIILAAFTTEVGSSNWIPLALVDDYGRTEAVAGIVYAGLVLAQSTMRIVGPRWLDRLGRVRTLRASAVLLAVGSLTFAFAPQVSIASIALVVWGIGTAFAFPVALSAAADDPHNATARVAAVSAFGSAGGLIVPQVIGLLAEVMEIRHALLLAVVAAAAIFVLAPAARPLSAQGH